MISYIIVFATKTVSPAPKQKEFQNATKKKIEQRRNVVVQLNLLLSVVTECSNLHKNVPQRCSAEKQQVLEIFNIRMPFCVLPL